MIAARSTLLGLVAALFYAVVSLIRYWHFHAGLDLAIFDQAVAGYAAGHMPYSDIKAQAPFNLLGDHFSPIVAVLAPLYRLWPHVELLLIAQAALFGLSVVLITQIARRSHDALASVLIGSAYALSRGVVDSVTFDFHEVAFAAPLVIWAIDSISRKRTWQAAGACVLLLLVKEDSAFLLVGIGLWLLFERRWRLGITYAIAGTVAFCVLIYLIIPVFSFYGRYTYLDSTSIGATGVADSLSLFVANARNRVVSAEFVTMVAALLLPTVGRCFLSPILLVAVPGLAARLAMTNEAYVSLGMQYNATVSAIVFLAAIDSRWRGLAVLSPFRTVAGKAVLIPAWLRKHAWPATAVGLAIKALYLLPPSALVVSAAWSCDSCAAAAAAVHAVPDGSDVAADTRLMSHLTDRTRVRLLNPSFTDSVGQPLQVDYVIADVSTPGRFGLVTRLVASGEYSRLVDDEPFVVLVRSRSLRRIHARSRHTRPLTPRWITRVGPT